MDEDSTDTSCEPIETAGLGKRTRPWIIASQRAWPVALAVGAVALITVAGGLTFGSIPVALRFARGERLILEPSTLKAEGLTSSSAVVVTTTIRNYRSKPVRLIGSTARGYPEYNCWLVTIYVLFAMADAIDFPLFFRGIPLGSTPANMA